MRIAIVGIFRDRASRSNLTSPPSPLYGRPRWLLKLIVLFVILTGKSQDVQASSLRKITHKRTVTATGLEQEKALNKASLSEEKHTNVNPIVSKSERQSIKRKEESDTLPVSKRKRTENKNRVSN